jgi:hypothetical protein
MALLNAVRNLGLYYYSSPPSRNVASSLRLGIMGEFDLNVDIMYQTSYSWRSEYREREPSAWTSIVEQGAQTSTSEGCVRVA